MAKGGLGLGGGLSSLFNDNTTEVHVKRTLRVSEIEPNKEQPRKRFNEETIAALAESIRDHGVLQPILVRPIKTGGYRIVAGERRWRAARMLGLDEVPVTIKDMTELESAQIALIENLQRENLNPVEEAEGYRELIDNYGMKHEELAKTVGRSRSSISNSLRILSLPEKVLKMLENDELSVGHAKALLGFVNQEMLVATALKAANGGLTVRQVEQAAAKSELPEPEPEKDNRRIDSYFVEMELSLNERLGRKVKVDYAKNKGVLVLEFYDKEDLAAIAERLTVNNE